jgi:hypothetical protein
VKLEAIEANPAMAAMIERCDEILSRKGKDYSSKPGALDNFRRAATALGVTPEQAMGVHYLKQVDAIMTYLRTGRLDGEPIEERIADAINYPLLLAKLVAEKGDDAEAAAVGESILDTSTPVDDGLCALGEWCFVCRSIKTTRAEAK